MVALIFAGIVLVFSLWFVFKKDMWKVPSGNFPKEWRIILIEKVDFYNHLSDEGKKRFEFKIQEFLLNCRITGISTSVDDTDRVLIAASAMIPIFAFPEWRYSHLHEVLVYPNSFNESFSTDGVRRQIRGMVGTGYMSGMMVLSKPSLYQGFANEKDRSNTAIHEFIHLLDTADGSPDGVPAELMKRQYVIPWLDLMKKEIKAIKSGDSDIRGYGATNEAEFFSVVSEYFFENPQLMKSRHPQLYDILERTFNQKLALWDRRLLKHKLRRNELCPCGSGKKFKKCCGSK